MSQRKRRVEFFIDGHFQRALETDVSLSRALKSFVANMRFIGIFLDGRKVRAVSRGGHAIEEIIKPKGRKATC